MDDPGNVEILTFGCRLNLWESEVIRGLAQQAGLADSVIVNSCAVTSEAERQARQAIRRARRERPNSRIIVTGCAAELPATGLADMPEVSHRVPNREKLDPRAWASLGHPQPAAEAMSAAPRVPEFHRNTRGFLQIQQGCDHRCTFCVIPLARGPSVSVPPQDVAVAAQRLAAQGHREIVLTGVDLTSWGADLPGRPTLGRLVRTLLETVPELPRLRLSSLDPAEIDEALWTALAEEPRLMPHFHFSVQAGDDLVLKQMKRRHSRADFLAVAGRARACRPGLALGADLIAGFPTESEAQFRQTLDLVEEAELDYLHVFPYSPRPGTPAARLRPLAGGIVRERATRLRAAGASRLGRRLQSLVGRTADVLVERGGTARTECFAQVRAPAGLLAGEMARVRLTGVDSDHLLGSLE